MRFKIYKSSVLATIVSIIGAVTCYGGILALFEKEFVAGIVCIIIGFIIQIGASEIAETAAFKKWKKAIVSKGYDQRVAQGDYTVAVQLYNQNPGEKTLKYFDTLNSNVTTRLRSAVQASSSKETKSVPASGKSNASPNRSAQTLRCSACGSEIGPDFQFCLQCGHKIEKVKRCLRCGEQLDDGARFCRECGYQVR